MCQLLSVLKEMFPEIVADLHLSKISAQKPQSLATSLSLSANARGCLKNKSSAKKTKQQNVDTVLGEGGKQGACQNMCAA